MATKTAIICDYCNIEKKDTNHWFKVALVNVHGQPMTFISGPANSQLSEYDNVEDIKDVCGREHAQVYYERFLDHGTLEERAPDEQTEPNS